MTDEQKIEKFCSFLQTPAPRMSFRRDHSKVLREVGRRSIELRLHVDKEFKTGGKQVNSKNNSLVLELFSSASVQSSQNIAGPWIRSLLNNQPLLAAYGNTDEHKELTSVEGIVAYFTLSLVWDDEVNAETWTKLSAFWTTLMTVLNSIDEQINNGTQPKKYNSDNSSLINQYLATIQNPKAKSSSGNHSGNLKGRFKDWLIKKQGQAEDLAKRYVNQIARLPNLIKEIKGNVPSVDVFEVSSLDEFNRFYATAIQWAQENDPKSSKYWKTSINTYFEPFLKDYFSANPVSGSGDLSYVELKDENDVILPRNLIYFGAPGTGKSFKLKEAVEAKRDENGKPVEEDKNGTAIDYERVTFYPTYSYAQFVGCYKPVMKPADGGKEEIAYEFVPGPFLRILVKALNDPRNNYCLVIEEINRANAAAVFGDVFQLLDRTSKDGLDGRVRKGDSEYDITISKDVNKFLNEDKDGLTPTGKDTLKKLAGEGRLKIPHNMYIWATMNSADQGVFPMDTAFKRRWEFKYVGIDEGYNKQGDKGAPSEWVVGDSGYYWDQIRRFVNKQLSDNGVNEDKLMGPWFVKPENNKSVSADQFKSKVLMYLWEDAGRMCRKKLFGDKIKTYSDIVDTWPAAKDVFKNVTDKDDENWKAPWNKTGEHA